MLTKEKKPKPKGIEDLHKEKHWYIQSNPPHNKQNIRKFHQKEAEVRLVAQRCFVLLFALFTELIKILSGYHHLTPALNEKAKILCLAVPDQTACLPSDYQAALCFSRDLLTMEVPSAALCSFSNTHLSDMTNTFWNKGPTKQAWFLQCHSARCLKISKDRKTKN